MLLVTLAEVEAVKKKSQECGRENMLWHLENDKLRERLGEVGERSSGQAPRKLR